MGKEVQHMKIEVAHTYTMAGLPAAPGDVLHANIAVVNDVEVVMTKQPDYPVNLVLTLTDANASITAGDVVIKGIDANGEYVTESFDCSSAGAKTGNIAFAKITSCLPTGFVGHEGGDVIAYTTGHKVGLPCGIDTELEEVYKEVHVEADQVIGTVNRTYKTYIPTAESNNDHALQFWYTVIHKIR
jgi:hypothetical protein